jgi:hypothetical protein
MPDSPTLTPDALESYLRDLDRAAFVAFVADLWSAGGWETEHGESVLTATRGDETRRILVWTDDRNRIERLLGVEADEPDVDAIDAVVARRRDGASAQAIAETRGARVIDTAGLHDRLLYAIGRERARELCRTHFGSAVEPRPPRASDREDRGIRDVLRPRTVLVAAVVLTLVAAVAVGLSGQPGNGGAVPDSGPPEGGVTGTPLITPVGAGGVTTASPAPEGTSAGVETARIPPDMRPSSERYLFLRANAQAYRNASFSCAETPGMLVETAVGAIRFNDPERNDGLRTVWRLTDLDGISFEELRDGITSAIYQPLFSFDRVAFEPPPETGTDARTAIVSTTDRAVVVARDGGVARYEFRLRSVSGGCWKIDQVFRTPVGGVDE